MADAVETRISYAAGSAIPDSPLEAFALEQVKQGMYPNVQTVLQLIATLPVVAVECEHNTSALRRLKNFMRNTSGQDRLSNLALMHVHYGHPVDVQKVVDIFAARHPHRLSLANVMNDDD